METRANERDVPSLLFPELWTTEYLICVLEKRYISRPDLHNLEREELLNIYYDLVLPKPQRSYRPNRRGQTMTAAQNLSNKRKRISAPDAADASQTYTLGVSQGLQPSSAKRPQYRLKPPPSAANPDRKVIRLSSSGSSTMPDAVVENEKIPSPVKSPTTLAPARTSGVIKLKRSSSSDNSPTSSCTNSGEKTPSAPSTPSPTKPTKTEKADTTEETPTKKPKFAKISWP